MSTDTSKIRSRLAKLDRSLDDLESQLEPLFAKPLPETLLAFDTIQQAKLQVTIPYVVYDLIFVYLKSRGIDPKSHRVVAELERVRQYFDKIKHAEESNEKRKLGIDKGAATRFIKHAIAQAKNAQLADEPPDAVPAASSSSTGERVPVKVTRKMVARAEYEKELEGLRGEEDDDLQVFEEAIDEDKEVMDADGPPEHASSTALDKGKGRALEDGYSLPRRKRPRVDSFSGVNDSSISASASQVIDHSNQAKHSTSMQSTPDSSRGVYASTSQDREVKKVAKKAKRKAKKKS